MSDPGRAAGSAARSLTALGFPADDAPLYTAGQVADILGVQPAYLRRLDTHVSYGPLGRRAGSAATAASRSTASGLSPHSWVRG